MPNWLFVVAPHFGGRAKRQQMCANIKRAVERRGAAELLPLVRYELGSRGEYYLGLAINDPQSEEGQIPEVACQVLEEAGLSRARLMDPVEADGLAALLKGSVDCESFTLPIAFERRQAMAHDDLMTLAAVLSEDDHELDARTVAMEDLARATQMDHLLTWCSAVGSGDIGRLRTACSTLAINIDPSYGGVWSVLRRLVLAGHVEFDPGRNCRWAVLPPTLVQSTGADGYWYLVGQRTPAILDSIRHSSDLGLQPQSAAPSTVHVGGSLDVKALMQTVASLQIAGPAAACVAARLPDRAAWKRLLPVWQESDFSRFSVETYSVDTDAWSPVPSRQPTRAGMYRFTIDHVSGLPYPTVTTVYLDEDSQLRCGDYYGMRFLARAEAGACRVAHRDEMQHLLIPPADRWPMPYERALVLASGMLPRRVSLPDGTSYLSYQEIPESLAGTLCRLLDVNMESI